MTLDAKDKLQLNRLEIVCTNTLNLVRQQPDRTEVENMIMKGLQKHEKDCDARKRLPVVAERQAENTGVIRAMMRPRGNPGPLNGRRFWYRLLWLC